MTYRSERKEPMKSLSDKMQQAFNLSLEVVYVEGCCSKVRDLPDKEADLAFAWAEGGMHKYYHTMTEGHCSLQRTMDFSIRKFEASVDRSIRRLKRLVRKYRKEPMPEKVG